MIHKTKYDRLLEEIEEALEAHGEQAALDLQRRRRHERIYGRKIRFDGDYAPLVSDNDNRLPLKKTG